MNLHNETDQRVYRVSYYRNHGEGRQRVTLLRRQRPAVLRLVDKLIDAGHGPVKVVSGLIQWQDDGWTALPEDYLDSPEMLALSRSERLAAVELAVTGRVRPE